MARDGRPDGAVVALEVGRHRLLAEALEYTNRELDLLPQRGHSDAFRRFRDAAELVEYLQHPDGAGDVSSGLDPYHAIQAARVELDAAIMAIRGIAGFEDFLVAPSWERIERAVTPQALLVYLVTTPAGSLC